MENMFSNDSRQFKFDVLVALCRSASKGKMKMKFRHMPTTWFHCHLLELDAAYIKKEKY